MEEKIKIVGKRITRQNVDWKQVNDFLKLVIELNRKNKFIPKGIYRFNSNPENDRWIMKTLTNH
jgi:hypothetical protein